MFFFSCGHCIVPFRRLSPQMKRRLFVFVVVVATIATVSSVYWANKHKVLASSLWRETQEKDGNVQSRKLSSGTLQEQDQDLSTTFVGMHGYEMGRVNMSERLPVARDVRAHEPWPEVQRDSGNPGNEVFDTVHWMWCSDKALEFRHYLSVLSAVRILEPRRLVMHFTSMPKTDSYNAWFNELQGALPTLEFEHLAINVSCDSTDTLTAALKILAQNGGIFIGQDVILTRFPELAEEVPCWFAFTAHGPRCARNGIVIARQALDESSREACFNSIMNSKMNCVISQSYGTPTGTGNQIGECVFVDKTLFPRDIMQADSPFGELARWLFYGRRAVVTIESEGAPIPRISHYIRILTNKKQYVNELSFGHFVSVLSALHVAGFRHVYVHSDVEPKGRWWEELRKENVTFVPLVSVNTVYQHPVKVTAHVSDLMRYLVLYKYGGAYQDWDVFWTQYLPDSLLANPAVLGLDWNRRGWPDNVNNGVMLARARSHFLHHFLATHRDYRDSVWAYNSLMMSYRTWELYPQTAFLDRRVQVLCHRGLCHPTWLPGYGYGGREKQPLSLVNETRAVHVTFPKPPPSLSSLDALRKGQDVYAMMGKLCLENSGRRVWLQANYTNV